MSPGRQCFDQIERRGFAAAADPHQWMLVAESLHEQAVALRALHGRSQITHREAGVSTSYDGTNRATFLLAAFALENAVKAFLVYDQPSWIGEGMIARDMRSHRLVELSEKTALIPYCARDQWVLQAFEAGNESWMRSRICGRDCKTRDGTTR